MYYWPNILCSVSVQCGGDARNKGTFACHKNTLPSSVDVDKTFTLKLGPILGTNTLTGFFFWGIIEGKVFFITKLKYNFFKSRHLAPPLHELGVCYECGKMDISK